jgi:hypothetical protein
MGRLEKENTGTPGASMHRLRAHEVVFDSRLPGGRSTLAGRRWLLPGISTWLEEGWSDFGFSRKLVSSVPGLALDSGGNWRSLTLMMTPGFTVLLRLRLLLGVASH